MKKIVIFIFLIVTSVFLAGDNYEVYVIKNSLKFENVISNGLSNEKQDDFNEYQYNNYSIGIRDMKLIGENQTIENFEYCSWPYNTSLYDSDENSISVFYCCKSYHTSSDGIWLMKKYFINQGKWSKPIVVASNEGNCFYGYATTITKEGTYVGICKDNMVVGNIYICSSYDKGLTWFNRKIRIDGNILTGETPCSLRMLSNGRWIFYLANPCRIVYSDDGMNTWNIVNLSNIGNYPDEAEIIELTDKTVCLVVRQGNDGRKEYKPMLLLSTDFGLSWTSQESIDWIDASATPISIYQINNSGNMLIFHASRYVVNNKMRYNLTLINEKELVCGKQGVTKTINKYETSWYDVGNAGYGSVVSDGKYIYYFTYRGVPTMNKNPKIYFTKMRIKKI